MTVSPDIAALVRQDYLDQKSWTRIMADRAVSKHQLCLCINGVALGLPPLPRHRKTAGLQPRRVTGDRDAVVKRLWITAERQVRDIEKRILLAKQEPAERERDARVMAVLVKALCDLSALDGAKAARGAAKSMPAGQESHDDARDATGEDISRDIEAFRLELARRIAALDPGATAGTGDGPEPAEPRPPV